MAIGGVLAAGVLAMGAQWFAMGPWSPVDLPYPEVETSDAMGGYAQGPEALVAESIAAWAKRTQPGRKHQVTEIKVEGTRATAKVLVLDRAVSLRLERVGEAWKVLEK
jgi:hypothetical protein